MRNFITNIFLFSSPCAVVLALTACQTTLVSENMSGSQSSIRAARANPRASVNIVTAYAIDPNAGVEDLVALALRHHPRIRADEAKVRRLFAKVPQAAALPDPKLRFSAGSMGETAAGRMRWMAGVEQALPFPGKLRAMARAAGSDAEGAAADLEATRLDIAEQVRTAYWNYYLAARTSAITSNSREALNLVRDSIDAKVAANQASQGAQLQLAAEFGKLESQLIESRRAESRARSALNSLLNRPPNSPLPDARADATATPHNIDTLLASAQENHPNVRRAKAELTAFRHLLQRARLDRFPDLTVGLRHGDISGSGLAPSANGRDQSFATVGVTVPIWQAPRRARVNEASAGMRESMFKMGAIRAKLRHRIEDAWYRAQAARDLITLFDKQILPEADQAFDVVLAAYAAGKQDFADVLNAWRQQLSFQLQQSSNRAQLGRALAALRAASNT